MKRRKAPKPETKAPSFAAAFPQNPPQPRISFLLGLAVNGIIVVLLATVRSGSADFASPAAPAKTVLIVPPVALSQPQPRPFKRMRIPRLRAATAAPLSATAASRITPPAIAPVESPRPVIAVAPQPPISMPSPVSALAAAVTAAKFDAAETAVRTPKLPRTQPVATGSFTAAEAGSAARVAGAVVSSGFEDATSGQKARSGTARVATVAFEAVDSGSIRSVAARPVASAGFDALAVSQTKPRQYSKPHSAGFHSVEILAKFRPEYTEEARRKRIEGEVWLEILFGADGKARVQRILRPLGYGLDENAVRAAGQIRFRPAREGSTAVDEIATVRVQFQLAE